MFGNGVVVSQICRDQFAITAAVTGCSSEWQGASCCAVFASDVAAYFLRGASDGVADISPAVIESLLWAAARLVSGPQSLIKGGVCPKESLSDALVRDQVAVVITDHVFGNKHEFMDALNARVRPFAMVVTAVPKTYVGTQSTTITGDSFVVLCSEDDCVVIDSHRHNSSGTLKGYKKGLHSAEAIASFIFEPIFGLLAMMGCVPTQLQVALAQPSLELQEAVHCDSDASVSDDEDVHPASSAEDEAPLPAGHPLCDYGLRFPDAGEMGSVDSSVMTPDPVSSKLVQLQAARSSGQVIKQSFSTEDNILRGLNSKQMIRRTMSRWLSEIKDDSRTHLQVATCTIFFVFDILPDIWASAVICVSKAQGFAPEILHMTLVSNVSYMDHKETKLRVKGPLDPHAINSDVAVTIANTASSKKSHLENMVTKLVNHHPDNLNKKLSQVSLGNGTIKGIRSALEKVKYAGIVSSEPTHTIRTPYPILSSPMGASFCPAPCSTRGHKGRMMNPGLAMA
jgi:hypothetical protein